jgi:hypothetical protein
MEQDEVEKNSQDSDITPNTELPDSFLNSSYAMSNVGSDTYNPDLREKVFYLWYNNGRPGFVKTKELINLNLPDEIHPNDWSLKDWLSDFNLRAFELDKRIHEQLDAVVIAEKVEMMKRHAKTGKYMQNIALQYIKDHLEGLSPTTSLRMLVEGVRIERESRGIPEALEKMLKMSDEDLMTEIKQLLTSSSVTLEDIDADS